ncbi:hypothetical protein PRBRB14_24760 [Hallella multisaccharivorax DSM 17128]|nr:hypothetical protein PRBRB14_24760 [Hallella multisaccharivorax DSM 17128]
MPRLILQPYKEIISITITRYIQADYAFSEEVLIYNEIEYIALNGSKPQSPDYNQHEISHP